MEKNVFQFQTSSEFDKSFETLLHNADFQKLDDKFSVKPFYLKFKGLKRFLNGFTFFIQVLTVAVSFICIVALLRPLMPETLAYAFSIITLVGIEFLKRLSFQPATKEFLQFSKISVFNVVLSLSMLAVSLWLTWNGGHDTVFTLTDKPELLNVDSLTGYEKQRISQLTAQLSEVKKTQSWKGVLTPKGQNSYNRITAQISKLHDKLDQKESDLNSENSKTTNEHLTKTTTNANRFRYITVLLDVVLFILLAWLEYYDYRSYTEFAKLKTIQETENATNVNRKSESLYDNRKTINVIPNEQKENLNESRTVIKGFKQGSETNDTRKTIRTPNLPLIGCLHCGNQFERKSPRHVFCSDSCRVLAWEGKTGKRVKRQKIMV